ncbi:CAP domain-containing protein [Cytobacillus horneckiae]|uniref:CAP domain-containing protein n=1 Tax=Cytobacillus horneckiae TaxID=549687 RepID=UPI003D9A9060
MKKFLLLILIGFVVYISWPTINEAINEKAEGTAIQQFKSDIQDTDFQSIAQTIATGFNSFIMDVEQLIKDRPANDSVTERIEKPELTTPDEKSISVYNLEIGDKRSDVEETIGHPQRSTRNEYGTTWHAYHENYQRFIMVSYDENEIVNGLYTNQDLISSSNGIKYGLTKAEVANILGEPLANIRKGLTYYQFASDSDYDVFELDGSYVTVFYDVHKNNTITSIQILAEEMEQNKAGFYGEPTQELKEGFEFQLFDLANAERVNHQIPVMTWDDPVRETAREHSADMAANNYFSHDNLEGQSPFDRMKSDDIRFRTAGENLAYGQFSSIFAHEGLMNSEGHRKNILKKDYQLLGVGVAFNDTNQPYFTQNFYTK